jgi:prepilin signal peptidase PulO-like enzyme (type II secretory pathway)
MLLKTLIRSQIGMGDVLILTNVSAFGDLIFFLRVLFVSFTIAGLIGVSLLLAKRINLKSQIKFVPFILFGAISTFFIS